MILPTYLNLSTFFNSDPSILIDGGGNLCAGEGWYITSVFFMLCLYAVFFMFDLRRLRAQTKSVERLIVEALSADDCALLAHSEADLHAIVNKFAEATHLFGLTISIKKTEELHQPSPAQRLPPPSIRIDGSELLNFMCKFTSTDDLYRNPVWYTYDWGVTLMKQCQLCKQYEKKPIVFVVWCLVSVLTMGHSDISVFMWIV